MKTRKKSPNYSLGLSFEVSSFPDFCAAIIVHDVRISASRSHSYNVKADTEKKLAENLLRVIITEALNDCEYHGLDNPVKILMADCMNGQICRNITDHLHNRYITEVELDDPESDGYIHKEFRLVKGEVFHNNNSGNDVIIVELINTEFEEGRK